MLDMCCLIRNAIVSSLLAHLSTTPPSAPPSSTSPHASPATIPSPTMMIPPVHPTASTTPPSALRLLIRLLVLNHVDDFVGDAEVFDLATHDTYQHSTPPHIRPYGRWVITHVIPPHVAFRQSVELVAVWGGLHDFLQGDVHVRVAGDEVAVEGFAGFELDEHRFALGGG